MHGDGGMDLQTTVQLTIPLEASDTNVSTECDATTSADLPQDAAAEAAVNSPTNALDNPENVLLMGWPTPKDSTHNVATLEAALREFQNHEKSLDVMAQMVGWPTPLSVNRERNPDEPGLSTKSGAGQVCASGWRDVEWLPCADGKARPTQPGIHPLADGIPGRVGQLRAYGNSIVPALAAEFVRAFMETNNA